MSAATRVRGLLTCAVLLGSPLSCALTGKADALSRHMLAEQVVNISPAHRPALPERMKYFVSYPVTRGVAKDEVSASFGVSP